MWVILDVQPSLIASDRDVARALSATVHAAAEHNLVLLENHPQTPRILDCARAGTLRYLSDLPGMPERVRSIPLLIKAGGGDCAELSAWRVAELWQEDLSQRGQRIATCKVYWRCACPYCKGPVVTEEYHCKNCMRTFLKPKRTFHAEVRRSDGEVEDLSRLMGM